MSRPLVIRVQEKDKPAAHATPSTVPQPKPAASFKASAPKPIPKQMTITSETTEHVVRVTPAPKPLPPKPSAATSSPTTSMASSAPTRPSVVGSSPALIHKPAPATIDMNMARSQTSYAGSKAPAVSSSVPSSGFNRQASASPALNGSPKPTATESKPAAVQPAHAHTMSNSPVKSALKGSNEGPRPAGRVTVNTPEKPPTPASSSPSVSSYSSHSATSSSYSSSSSPSISTYDSRASNKGGVGASVAANSSSRKSLPGAMLNTAASKASSPIEFLQHQAAVASWLEELTKSPFPSKDHSPASFLAVVSNGVLLCKAMQVIDERAIPRINQARTPMQIRDNLNCFLEACRELGVPELNLFRLPDMLSKANAVQVVECIYALSKVCQKNGFRPALRENTSSSFPSGAVKEAEQLHARFGRKDATSLDALLESDAARLEGRSKPVEEPSLPSVPSVGGAGSPPPVSPRSHKSHKSSHKHHHHHDHSSSSAAAGAAPTVPPKRQRSAPAPPPIRQDLLKLATPKSIKGITRFQAIVRGRAARALFLQRRRDTAYRDRVAQEILSTEQSYVAGLQNLVRLYLDPLEAAIRDGKPILSKEEVKTIFGNIQVILGVNTVLLKDIEPRVKAWGPQQCLGDIFLNICKFLKVYTQFIRDYSVIMATIATSLKQNKKFESFCKGAEREAKGYSLDSFLILPVQRIPRYILLLNELKKHTWPEHKDYKAVVEAWTQVQEVANYVNQKKKESEDLSKVLEIESQIEGVLKHELVEAHRKFVAQVEVKLIKDKKKTDRTLLVFNDLVLVTKHAGDKYKLSEEINLDPKKSNAVVTKENADNSLSLVNDLDAVQLTFMMEPPEKRDEVRDMFNRLRGEFDERSRASDAQATKRAQQKVEDFKHLVEASVESDLNTSSEALSHISKGGSMKMRPRRQHPENVQKLKDELKKITPDKTKELLTEERAFVKIIPLSLQASKKKAKARALFVCNDIALLLQPEKDQQKHPDEYKYLETYQVTELSARGVTGPCEGVFAELVHGEGTATVGPFKFADETERKTFIKDITSVHNALLKAQKEAEAAKLKKSQKKADSVKKELAASYGKSSGDKAAKQIQEKRDGEDASDATAASNASEGGLRKWAQKKEEMKQASLVRSAKK